MKLWLVVIKDKELYGEPDIGDLRRFARRVLDVEALALAMAVLRDGWTDDHAKRLEWLGLAAYANYDGSRLT